MKGQVDFAAVYVKGLIEQNDPSAYFGSTLSLKEWGNTAIARGWVSVTGEVTEKGYLMYRSSGVGDLPKVYLQRAYFWDWSKVDTTPFYTEGSKT
jgi:hypothetical protein